MFSLSSKKVLLPMLGAALLSVAIGTIAIAAQRSERIDKRLCKTTGGGRFVAIPGFPGEKIDRRLKRDVKYLVRRYKLHITDGYSLDPVHSRNGEHPIGLALDIVPDFSRGGRWRDVSRLARWAEPSQNRPRLPFRWVGYNGDANHGRGHHLHLSWAHSETRYNHPARTVYSIRCPRRRGGGGGDEPPKTPAEPPKDEAPKRAPKRPSGGISPSGSSQRVTGGVRASSLKRKVRRKQRSLATAEAGGVSAR